MVPKSLKEVLEAYSYLKPDIIQVHGEFLNLKLFKMKQLEAKIVRAIPVGGAKVIEKAISEAAFSDGILVDSYIAGKFGGTGITHNWSISRLIRGAIYPKPLILAGGLNPRNVAEAIKIVKPYAVDVSTGVELSPGIKDQKNMKFFIMEAKKTVLEDDYYSLNL